MAEAALHREARQEEALPAEPQPVKEITLQERSAHQPMAAAAAIHQEVQTVLGVQAAAAEKAQAEKPAGTKAALKKAARQKRQAFKGSLGKLCRKCRTARREILMDNNKTERTGRTAPIKYLPAAVLPYIIC